MLYFGRIPVNLIEDWNQIIKICWWQNTLSLKVLLTGDCINLLLYTCYSIYRIYKVFDEFNSKNNFTSRRNFSTNRAVFVIKHILLQALVQFMLIKPKIHNKISCHRPRSENTMYISHMVPEVYKCSPEKLSTKHRSCQKLKKKTRRLIFLWLQTDKSLVKIYLLFREIQSVKDT